MRTTLNIDDDVAARLRQRSLESGRSLSRTANDVLREGLASGGRPPGPPYDPPSFDTGTPFVDVTDVAAAIEVVDDGR